MIAGISGWFGCVDPVNLAVKADELPTFIEGLITDQDGPDTIKITKAYPVDGGYHNRVGIVGAWVTVSDDAGNLDTLTDISGGYYVTSSITGTIGRTYKLSGVLPDGTIFESTLERMAPAGMIDSIGYEFTSRENKETDIQEEGISVYVNATADPSSSLNLRWKFNGTYSLHTDPSLVTIPNPCLNPVCPPIPLPCATNCQCCDCYASLHEAMPILYDTRTQGSMTIYRKFIQYIPINNLTFNQKFRVEVVQMDVSKTVYDFYFAVKRQIEGASNLFQPPFFELPGNVETKSGTTKVVGIFSAAAQERKAIYILRSDLPYPLATEVIPGDCRAVAQHSTTTVPPFWN